MKLIMMFADAARVDVIRKDLAELGAPGYTVLPVAEGGGRTGIHTGDRVHPGALALVMVIDEDAPATQLFDKPGVVKMYCDIHQHMRGIILVLDTPYFTRTTNGVYRLQDLPAGHYLLKAWVNETHVYERPVELKPAEQLHVDFDAK